MKSKILSCIFVHGLVCHGRWTARLLSLSWKVSQDHKSHLTACDFACGEGGRGVLISHRKFCILKQQGVSTREQISWLKNNPVLKGNTSCTFVLSSWAVGCAIKISHADKQTTHRTTRDQCDRRWTRMRMWKWFQPVKKTASKLRRGEIFTETQNWKGYQFPCTKCAVVWTQYHALLFRL